MLSLVLTQPCPALIQSKVQHGHSHPSATITKHNRYLKTIKTILPELRQYFLTILWARMNRIFKSDDEEWLVLISALLHEYWSLVHGVVRSESLHQNYTAWWCRSRNSGRRRRLGAHWCQYGTLILKKGQRFFFRKRRERLTRVEDSAESDQLAIQDSMKMLPTPIHVRVIEGEELSTVGVSVGSGGWLRAPYNCQMLNDCRAPWQAHNLPIEPKSCQLHWCFHDGALTNSTDH